MTQEKMRRIIAACVSAATVLFVLLLSFLIYQFVTMAVLDKRIEKAEAEVAYWTAELEKHESGLEYYESEWYLNQAWQELKALQEKK